MGIDFNMNDTVARMVGDDFLAIIRARPCMVSLSSKVYL